MKGEKILLFIDCIAILNYSIIVILSIVAVLLRYFFNTSIVGGSEIGRILFIYANCLGTVVLLRRNGHINLDIFLKFVPKFIEKILLIINNISLILLHGYLLYLSMDWVVKVGMVRTEHFRIPMKYVQYVLPISFILIIFYSFWNLYDVFFDNKLKG